MFGLFKKKEPSEFVRSIIVSLEMDDWSIDNDASDTRKPILVREDGRLSVDEFGHVWVKKPTAHYRPDRLIQMEPFESKQIRVAVRKKVRDIVTKIASDPNPEAGG